MQDALGGHWRRDWICAGDVKDSTTRVHWLQAGALFADVRIPAERPELSGRAYLAELSAAEMLVLLRAEGFAGEISVEQDLCTWTREVNWHGVPEGADIGRMSFEDGALLEDGVLADYRERWLSVGQGPLRGHRLRGGGLDWVLIEDDEVFLLGGGVRPEGTSRQLIEELEAGQMPAARLRAQFASVYCLGHWQGAQGVARLSTNPFHEGRTVLRRGADFSWLGHGFDGTPVEVALTPVG